MNRDYRLWIRVCLNGIDRPRIGWQKAKATTLALLAVWGMQGFDPQFEACAKEGVDLIAGPKSSKKVVTDLDRRHSMSQAEKILVQHLRERRELAAKHRAELDKDAKNFHQIVSKQVREEKEVDVKAAKKLGKLAKEGKLRPAAKDRVTSPSHLDIQFQDTMPNVLGQTVDQKRLGHRRISPPPAKSKHQHHDLGGIDL